MERHVQESALPLVANRRRTGDRRGFKHAIVHDPQSAGALRNQHVTVGKKGHGPWILQRFNHGHDPVGFQLGLVLSRLSGKGEDHGRKQRRRTPTLDKENWIVCMLKPPSGIRFTLRGAGPSGNNPGEDRAGEDGPDDGEREPEIERLAEQVQRERTSPAI